MTIIFCFLRKVDYDSQKVMHNASPVTPPLTIGGTVLMESYDLDKLGVTFDSKMSFENHFHSVSRAASLDFYSLSKSWPIFHYRSLLGRCFRGFILTVLPVLEYCSAVWCSAAETHLKLLDRMVSGAHFVTGGVFKCGIAHRRSVRVLCMLQKYRYNRMQSLHGALPMPYVHARFGDARCAGRASLYL